MYSSGDYYQQDPYAPRQLEKKKKKKRNNPQQVDQPEKRANSYLPYTNHNRDPYSVEPVYLQEEDQLPNFNSPHSHNGRGPVGSILQDNIVMDTINDESDYYDNHSDINKKEQILPLSIKKSWWVRLGISGKKLVFSAFGTLAILVIIWYFVWPRTPTLAFLDAGLKSGGVYTPTSMEAVWTVNFTVNNRDNWVPTNINNFAVNVLDGSTGEVFGSGNTNSLKLWPRSIDQTIKVDIYINFTRDATSQTLINLRDACTVINRDQGTPPAKQTLDIRFSVVYYIAGIIWNPVSTFSPLSYFQCPMPPS
ncbi:hypothetical protein BD770DRAFT_82075 [Pilaira anomala]|nr:hypothetical protein BD770DRAFT_82075 [Pilaira anomala]